MGSAIALTCAYVHSESGPLVMSYGQLEDYYQEQGRDWNATLDG